MATQAFPGSFTVDSSPQTASFAAAFTVDLPPAGVQTAAFPGAFTVADVAAAQTAQFRSGFAVLTTQRGGPLRGRLRRRMEA